MKKGMFVLFCLALFIVANVSLGANPPSNIIKPKTQQGDMALLFTINGLGDFGVNGSETGYMIYPSDEQVESDDYEGIGFKGFLRNRLALRLGVGFHRDAVNTEVSNTSGTGDEINAATSMSVQGGLEYHIYQAEAVTIYTGGLLGLARDSASLEEPDADKSTSSATTISIDALIGAEFYPWKNLSFGAEYRAGAAFGTTKSESGDHSHDGPKSSCIGIGVFSVILGFHFSR
jgi:opacity protein-like surface antigen